MTAYRRLARWQQELAGAIVLAVALVAGVATGTVPAGLMLAACTWPLWAPVVLVAATWPLVPVVGAIVAMALGLGRLLPARG